ncbi:Fe-S cluster assembly ATPase SufC [Candidatus Peregrinibacteria bacterium CG11_big_fil_rev_8_21_14_0_20_41_10]|nr:MAG: Fe-S cluster assembly ATPase SufC [Candidatus Peregrinibacteria bacterium CG11_big_fil_rev_8_21_14_0_20_41_10]PIZ73659.1 MAG: Fe-S cluster assembly ATPase SufC [Candidatus Peregrinibacteria bacterium CG_4_10_14_0_2_um_filter_41_8]PJC38392.1 MAG: Fe-S cluster assembly ATPase SufC [Candidatus Peregrinibacteria bacterium CG_4_9_14_0_2_um_filter_41_14]
MEKSLIIKNLHVEVEGKKILKGVNLEVKQGEVHCIMGPNGSGKSTLAKVIMGHPKYKVIAGEIWFGGQNILELTPDERARMGVFLAFQYPQEIAGVNFLQYLTTIYNIHLRQMDPGVKAMKSFKFKRMVQPYLEELRMDPDFLNRYLNEGFSGGEKKKAEILQLKLIKPNLAMLDETDSGLDVDALRIVAEGVKGMLSSEMGALVVTHYRRILDYIEPDYVHMMYDGQIVKSGGCELAHMLEEIGYEWITADTTV